ncbi:MAG: hypothetical protein HC919_00855 [Oscillatoriales cyanobacterium SM2_2_1]|nr:hypothetical protein [Oscillatoriales cyanobacterium SM2_2_1]
MTKITLWTGVLGVVLLWTGDLTAQEAPKVGTPRSLPLLQTRARPPLASENLYMGMTETDFFAYAREHNWAAVTSKFVSTHGLHRLQPGGGGVVHP